MSCYEMSWRTSKRLAKLTEPTSAQIAYGLLLENDFLSIKANISWGMMYRLHPISDRAFQVQKNPRFYTIPLPEVLLRNKMKITVIENVNSTVIS